MWYAAGTVTLTNGSVAVVGANLDFLANGVGAGDALIANGTFNEIARPTAATSLDLVRPWLGATGVYAYMIVPIVPSRINQVLADVGTLLGTFGVVRDGVGQGLFPDGTVAAPGIRFAADQDTGICRVGANQLGLVSGGLLGATLDASGMLTLKAVTLNGDVTQRITRSYQNPGYQPARLALGVAADHVVFEAGATAENNTPGQLAILTKDVGGNLQERMRIDAFGRVGIGTASPANRLHLAVSQSDGIRLTDVVNGKDLYITMEGGRSQFNSNQAIDFAENGTASTMRLSGGNVLVGVTSGVAHAFTKNVSEGSDLLYIYSTACLNGAVFGAVSQQGWNSAKAALYLGKNSTTGRSISAAGTINASGADYAEYVRKALACGTILKGDVCGIDNNGQLTRTWADARRYVVKSTDPNLVGGDTWAAHLGPRPEAPLYAAPAYDGPAEPTKPVEPAAFMPPVIEMPVQPVRGDGEDDDAYLLRLAAFLNDRDATIAQAQAAAAAQIEAAKAQVAYAAAVDQYQADLAAYRDAQAAYRTAVDAAEAAHAVALAEHAEALSAWEAELEAARQTVDRIAFSGQVPVNVDADTLAACEAALGDGVAVYLVAVARGAGIGVAAVREADMTLPLYMRRLGAVWAIRDGRPWIDVQHG